MDRFAVIDTETTWGDDVMSIGVVIADRESFEAVDERYYVLTPYNMHGGMYSGALYAKGVRPHLECCRPDATSDLDGFLLDHGISSVFAYNASFDRRHLPELAGYDWYDIMKVAAYRQHNPGIPNEADCCRTGRLRRGYGVESVYRMLSGDRSYNETHNALTDAADELTIMKMLRRCLEEYGPARIG